MLTSMQMAEEFGDDDNEPESREAESDEEQPRTNETEEEQVEEEAGSDATPADESEASQEEMEEGEMDGAEMSDEEMSDDLDEDPETPGETRRPNSPFDDFNEKVDYRIFTQNSTRKSTPRNCATRRSLTACARFSTNSSPIFRAPSDVWRTGCNAA